MKLTRQWFKEKGACTGGYEWVCNQFESTKEIESVEIVNHLIADEKLDWANWTICRVLIKEHKVKYAIFAAELVLHIYEEKYPNDDRPRKAIEAAKEYLKNPNSTAAADAARAAYAAARTAAARAAADAARAAAAAARTAAADAARAAYAAAARTAARKEMQLKILNYGLELLKETENVTKD